MDIQNCVIVFGLNIFVFRLNVLGITIIIGVIFKQCEMREMKYGNRFFSYEKCEVLQFE